MRDDLMDIEIIELGLHAPGRIFVRPMDLKVKTTKATR